MRACVWYLSIISGVIGFFVFDLTKVFDTKALTCLGDEGESGNNLKKSLISGEKEFGVPAYKNKNSKLYRLWKSVFKIDFQIRCMVMWRRS